MNYPRRTLLRTIINTLGRLLFNVLGRIEIVGKENIPKDGPVILASNHQDTLDVPIMAIFAGRHVEIIGTDDIPLPSLFKAIMILYGFIPIRRGEFDRNALNNALAVLGAGGVVGIFPEGGLWETDSGKLRHGVAWLSMKANAPVVTVGLGGTAGAIGKAFRLQRPRILVNVGEPVYPPAEDRAMNGRERKEHMAYMVEKIVTEFARLIPEEYRSSGNGVVHDFCIHRQGETLYTSTVLGRTLFNMKFATIMQNNLRLPVQSILRMDDEQSPDDVRKALGAILNYTSENPGFFEYRLGRGESQIFAEEIRQCYSTLEAVNGPIVISTSCPQARKQETPNDQPILS